jgi:hypothetical protein
MTGSKQELNITVYFQLIWKSMFEEAFFIELGRAIEVGGLSVRFGAATRAIPRL